MATTPDTKRVGGLLIDDFVVKELAGASRDFGSTFVPKDGKVTRLGGQNIVTIEMPKDQAVSSFEPGKLRDTRGIRYSDIVKNAPADAAYKKSARFRVSELTRGPLSVEAEEEARIEAEVQKRLAARIEELRVQTTTEAHRQGLEIGREEGKTQVLQEGKVSLAAFEALVHDFEGMRTEVFKANEELILHMVFQLAKSVILRELKEDAEYTRRLAAHVLERMGTRENIKIFVSEVELSSAEKLKDGLAQILGQLKNISIEPDIGVTGGGCRIETEFGEVDARIEVQIQNMAQGLGVDPVNK